MFEKFDGAARAAIMMSKDIADYRGLDHISTGHLLLAVAGHPAPKPHWKNWQGISPKAAAVIAALGTTPEVIIDQTMPELERGSGTNPGHVPFTPDLKLVLEYALRASMMLGDNHIGPEHLLAGLTRAEDSTAGRVLARLGITDAKVHAAIRESTPVPSPTAARTCDVYLPVGKSVFKNGGKIYPDLATAQTAHPNQDIAPFPLQLSDGEFFDVGIPLPGNRFDSWSRFTSYADAFAAAEDFTRVQGVSVKIRILVPHVQELYGKDSSGRDRILGRAVEYTGVSIMSRVVTPTLHLAESSSRT
ncbi:hypothetical protein GCM10023063_15370 [Arthrobacter methylotrophus]|uniref:Clp protease N-terminal domain-containing protein n=1 Tax=Arthrobacter methylotrophus TaxID=121291 RepID=A0ABV5UN60_9MICC